MSSRRENFRRKLPLIMLLAYTFIFHVGLFMPDIKKWLLLPDEKEKVLKYLTDTPKIESKYSLKDPYSLKDESSES